MPRRRPADATASAHAIVENPRPLPAHPNLEFERKRAKKLLRELKRTNANAKLADAQFAVAREYGFSSWPKLVEYFETSERHELSAPPPAWYPLANFEQMAQGVLKRHERKQPAVGAALAMFIPRLYGKTAADALAATVTIDDARLVIARQNRLPSWETLMEFANSRESDHLDWDYYATPRERAFRAIRNGDVAALTRVIVEHPELLAPRGRLDPIPSTLVHSAIFREFSGEIANARAITNTLVAHGADLRGELNRMLTSFLPVGIPVSRSKSGADYVEFLLERGADPNWIAPNGLSVLEHFLLRAMSAEAVDVIARRVTPRKALWIAAGLGDVAGVEACFDRHGRLTQAARQHRPDFIAAGVGSLPSLLSEDDHEIMFEAFYVAAMNFRPATMDALLNRGLPVDFALYGETMLGIAIGNRRADLVEYLLKRGAQFDRSEKSLRQLDEWMLSRDPMNVDTQRIYELCGGRNADAVMRRRKEEREKPAPWLGVDTVLARARQDAAHLDQREVSGENILVALLRDERHFALGLLNAANVDLAQLRRSLGPRLELPNPGVHPQGAATSQHSAGEVELPLSAAANELLDAARQRAHERRSPISYALLAVLVGDDAGPVADMLRGAGGDLSRLRERAGAI